jgi:xanthine/CO dehydrogenase XdhC/CoxF family maturation factor
VSKTLTCARCSDTGLDVARWAQRGWTPPDDGVCHGCGGPWPNPLPSVEAEQAAELASLRAVVHATREALCMPGGLPDEALAQLAAADALREAVSRVADEAESGNLRTDEIANRLDCVLQAHDRARRGEP